MEELKKNITGLLQETDEVVELFYQQKDQDAYKKLETLIAMMMNTIDQIFAYKADKEDFDIDEEGLAGALKETLSVMEDKDTVLIADVLKYEVMEKFQEIQNSLQP